MEILEKIKAQLEAYELQKQSLVGELRKEFPPMLKPLFEKSGGKIESVGWTQYTDYFNDGDECTFSVHAEYGLYINDEYEDDMENLDWRIQYFLKDDPSYSNLLIENPDIDIELYKAVEEFKAIINSIPEEFMKDLFGDHVKVTVYANGEIETEEYEHD